MAAPDGDVAAGPGRRRSSVAALREQWLRRSSADFAATARELDVPVRRGSVKDRAKLFQDVQAAVGAAGSPATASGSKHASSGRPKSSSALGSKIRELQGAFQAKEKEVERGKSALGCGRAPDGPQGAGAPRRNAAPSEPEPRPQAEQDAEAEGAADPSPARRAATEKKGRVLDLAQQLSGDTGASVEEGEDSDSDASDASQGGRGWGQEMLLTSETEALVTSQAVRRKLRGLRD